MILPLPVKKNKFGQCVAEISVVDCYTQIMEEVMEANVEMSNEDSDSEAEELVDVITCCITRLDIIGKKFIADEKLDPTKNFYRTLTRSVLFAFKAVTISRFTDFPVEFEVDRLFEVIGLCIERLKWLGYDETARQKLYQAVNEKNRRRGYFEE